MVQRVIEPEDESTGRPLADILIRGVAQVPWEQLILGGAAGGTAGAITSRAMATPKPETKDLLTTHPGCDVADATLHVQKYLETLSKGYGGFGVLRLGKDQLEEAAATAESIGRNDVGRELRVVAGQLKAVETTRSKEAATILAAKMEPLVQKTWRLGRVCGLTRR